jgi:hypothetical protein
VHFQVNKVEAVKKTGRSCLFVGREKAVDLLHFRIYFYLSSFTYPNCFYCYNHEGD